MDFQSVSSVVAEGRLPSVCVDGRANLKALKTLDLERPSLSQDWPCAMFRTVRLSVRYAGGEVG
jgi:hypothetical protein